MPCRRIKHLHKATRLLHTTTTRRILGTELSASDGGLLCQHDMQVGKPNLTRKNNFLLPYVPPRWAADLKGIPKYKVQLGNTHTPIHKWNLPGCPDDIEIFIKRDDMTGSDLSGNKTRRLEFLLADALDKECTSVVTAGDVFSNHCRCTAIGARRLGLQPHLILKSPISILRRQGGKKGRMTLYHACRIMADENRDVNVIATLTSWGFEDLIPQFSVTAGDVFSNHCRYTAIGARRLGLQSHLILKSPISTTDYVPCCGNALLYRLAGAQMYLAPSNADYLTELKPRVEQLVHILRHECNEDAYPIHYGGSSSIGVFGCLESYNELIQQDVLDYFTDVVVTVSSAGEAAGLAIGNYMTGSKLRIHGFCFSSDKITTQNKINRLICELGVCQSNHVPEAEEITDVIDRASCLEDDISSHEEQVQHEFICDVATSTGVILDPTYTGRSAFNLVKQLQHNPARFKGSKILFIHTGGIFGLFDGRMESVAKQASDSCIHDWVNLDENPFQQTEEAEASRI